jgi:ubiquinone/menaquinone biosynthesis C-methylase UbiE
MRIMRQDQDNNLISVKTYDCFAHVYEQWFMDISPYKARVDEFCNYISSSRAKILDLGCGPGNYSKYLADYKGFRNIHGFDLSEQMINRARKNVPIGNFQLGDVRKLRLTPSSYRGVLASFCVPYLSYHETDKLIMDIYKALMPSGVVYVSCMEGVKCGFEQTSFSGEMAVYIYYYTEDFLTASMEEKGFQVISVNRQPYLEVDGSVSTDLIIIAQKTE